VLQLRRPTDHEASRLGTFVRRAQAAASDGGALISGVARRKFQPRPATGIDRLLLHGWTY
jgi:hypothetical protein